MDYTIEEVKGMEKQLILLLQKKNKLRERLLTIQGTDAAQEFVLEEQIAEAEGEIEKLRKKLAGIHNLYSEEGKTILSQKVKELNIEEELGQIHLVNCGREKMRDRFWDIFDQWEGLPFQFYFISACPTQMPPSFAERMVYELIYEELDDDESAISCLRREQDNRVRIIDLPMKRNLEKSQQAFRSFFSEYFNFTEEVHFDQYLKTGLPKVAFDYIAMPFEIHEGKWKSFIPTFFQWLIDTFSETHEEVPHFLFFFVVYIEGLHEEGKRQDIKQEIFDQLNTLASENEAATHLSPLLPVPKSDLKAWIVDLGERNDGKIEELIKVMVRGLSPEDRKLFDSKKQFNMDDIERLQEIIYQLKH